MKPALILMLLLLLPTAATAAGIGVAPAELNFNIEEGKTQWHELTVYNLDNAEVELDAASDSDFLKFSYEGSVSVGGKGKVVVEADAKKLKKGIYTPGIYITAKSKASGVRLNLGTAVKAKVEVFSTRKTDAATGAITSFAIVILGLLAYTASERLRRYLASQKA